MWQRKIDSGNVSGKQLQKESLFSDTHQQNFWGRGMERTVKKGEEVKISVVSWSKTVVNALISRIFYTFADKKREAHVGISEKNE